MIKLTDLQDNPIWVAKSWVQSVQLNTIWSGYSHTAQSLVVLSGITYAVKEPPDVVVAALK